MVSKVADVLPSPDLLEQVHGVDKALRQGRRVGLLGWLILVGSAIPGLAGLANNIEELRAAEWSSVIEHWPTWLAFGLIVLALALINWTRLWVRQSRTPFRFTYSVADFQPVDEAEGHGSLVTWLTPDLSEKLSERIRRLTRAQNDESGEPTPGRRNDESDADAPSHVHISGTYGVRIHRDGRCQIQVTPWVRMGGTEAPAMLAHPVKVTIQDDRGRGHAGPTGRGTTRTPRLRTHDYETLVERIYFSVATEIYHQIRQNVQQKIELLPTRSFRAAAYFHEAEDYLRSNTLDAYQEAQQLYGEVIAIYNPDWAPSPTSEARRAGQALRRAWTRSARWCRIQGSRLWQRMADVEVMAARAELGYANTLLYRRALARVSGQRLNPVFETRPVAEGALERLHRLPDDVRGVRAAVLDAHVTVALSCYWLDAIDDAKKHLRAARQIDPAWVERNARYLFAWALIEPSLMAKMQLLRQAVELEPDFEVAQFELAQVSEMVWRQRPTLEEGVARAVIDEYEKVLVLNPGNIAAWAHTGYMYWLLGHRDDARIVYERGREYKEIKRETFVAELDFGLARLAAEEGDFTRAYRHYENAIAATVGQPSSHGPQGYTDYQFELISSPMVDRFKRYIRLVRRYHKHRTSARDQSTPSRVYDRVYGFALNDYGEACFNYFLRTADERSLRSAQEAFRYSDEELGTRYVLLYRNLHRLSRKLGDDSGDYMLQAHELNPGWAEGMVAMVNLHAERARKAASQAERAKKQVQKLREQAAQKRTEASRIEQDAAASPADDRSSQVGQKHSHVAGFVQSGFEQKVSSPISLLDEADRAERDARHLAEEVKRQETEAERRREDMNELLEKLLPHSWLWVGGGSSSNGQLVERRLRSSALGRADYARQLKWEREFDDLQVQALYAWSSTRPDEEAEQVVRHLRKVFWRDDFPLVRDCYEFARRRATAGKGKRARARSQRDVDAERAKLRALIRRSCDGEPEYWRLNWLTVDFFDPSEIREGLVRLLHDNRDRAPQPLYQWLGDTLQNYAPEEAMAAYRRIRDGKSASLHQAKAKVLWKLEQRKEAITELEAASAASTPSSAWRTAFVRQTVETLASQPSPAAAKDFWLLRDWLRKDIRGRAGHEDDPGLRDAREAIARLAGGVYLEFVKRPAGQASSDTRLTLSPLAWWPIRLDAHPAFFPQGGETPQVVRIIDEVIPRAQERIRKNIGLGIPGVRIRANGDLAAGEYELFVYGVSVGAGNVPATGAFCPDAEACRNKELSGESHPHPGDGRLGVWLPEDTDTQGLEVWEPLTYMVYHLERALLSHLGRLVNLDEARRLLDEWQGDSPERRGLRKASVPDERSLVRFVQVLRRLADERTPMKPVEVLLAAFERWGARDPQFVVEQVRSSLPPSALGVGSGTKLVAVPWRVEETVRRGVIEADGKRFLALSHEDWDGVLRSVRAHVAGHPLNDTALLVRDQFLRPYLAQAVKQALPFVPVVSRTEVGGRRFVEDVEDLLPVKA